MDDQTKANAETCQEKKLPILDYARPTKLGLNTVGFWTSLFLILFCTVVFIYALRPDYFGAHPGHSHSPRVKCASNLMQIGTSLHLYLNELGGVLPPDFGPLVEQVDFPAELFVCPSTSDKVATGATTRQVVGKLLSEKGHLSYIYVGQGLAANQISSDMILAYEPLANHADEGMNILFGDGHPEWFIKAEAIRLIAELNAGHNPPRPKSGN
jgi:prepilin-type processing-associated H-X9-DG protein